MATQEKTWNVANRMHSQKDSDNPEVNHIIAGADEIYDDAKGAKQSDINAQTDAALADRYTKSETYSKEQLNSLITTPDVEYVTVATFADLPQPGRADTIYRVSFYDGTQVDASKYALYAWNGATYQLLAVRSAIGEVFDVSEYNSGATYETLAGALAAVPASVQRGGMSIKFILRTNTGTEEEPVYHDEYVQYRLMNTDWSTVANDWQGMDSELIAGSRNLVESGVVQNEFALGAVYDVSAKNPTAGPNNDGKFESLSALLSDANLNTLIPTAVRRGGMSIKFIQSSDNKYVQYRYMSTATTGSPNPFLDTANWQGVDEEPVHRSNNLLKDSEAVYTQYLKNQGVYDALGENLSDDLSVTSTRGKAWVVDNGVASLQNATNQIKAIEPVGIEEGDIFMLECLATSDYDALLYVDDGDGNGNYNVLPSYTCSTEDNDSFFSKAPVGAKYALITARYSNNVDFKRLYYINVPALVNAVNTIGGKVDKDIFDLFAISGNKVYSIYDGFIEKKCYYISDDTIDVSTSSSNTSIDCIVISCLAGDKFTVTVIGPNTNTLQAWSFVDVSGNVLKSSGSNNNVRNAVITAPENAANLVVNAGRDYDYYVIKGTSSAANTNEIGVINERLDKAEADIGNATKKVEKSWDVGATTGTASGNIGSTITTDSSASARSYYQKNVENGKRYRITVRTRKQTSMPAYVVYFVDVNNVVVGQAIPKADTPDTYTVDTWVDYDVVVPANAVKMYVNTYVAATSASYISMVKVYELVMTALQTQIDNIVEQMGTLQDEIDGVKPIGIPDYYTDIPQGETKSYLTKKIDTILTLQDSISRNGDSFFFVTDYHIRTNAGHSIALIKYITERTGINKIIFGGDIGGTTISTDECVDTWNSLLGSAEEHFSVIGNHEWTDHNGSHTQNGVANLYIARHKLQVDYMDTVTGSYYVDNKANKIRYYFLQDTSGAAPINGTIDWFGNSLMTVPSGYAVLLIIHMGYIYADVYTAENDGIATDIDTTSNSHVLARRLNMLLGGFTRHTSVTVGGVAYDYTNTNGIVVGVFSGHQHHGLLMTKDHSTNDEGVASWKGSTDSLQAVSFAINGHPWYWENGIVGGTKVERTINTIIEQCFYAIQIDIDNRKVYITAIGGDHDYEFEF